MKEKRYTYERMNKSDDVLTVDLHNGYSVMAVSGWHRDERIFVTTLYISKNGYDCWKIVEDAKNLVFQASHVTISSAILKQIANYAEKGFFDSHIKRYEFMLACVDSFYKLLDMAEEDESDEEV